MPTSPIDPIDPRDLVDRLRARVADLELQLAEARSAAPPPWPAERARLVSDYEDSEHRAAAAGRRGLRLAQVNEGVERALGPMCTGNLPADVAALVAAEAEAWLEMERLLDALMQDDDEPRRQGIARARTLVAIRKHGADIAAASAQVTVLDEEQDEVA